MQTSRTSGYIEVEDFLPVLKIGIGLAKACLSAMSLQFIIMPSQLAHHYCAYRAHDHVTYIICSVHDWSKMWAIWGYNPCTASNTQLLFPQVATF